MFYELNLRVEFVAIEKPFNRPSVRSKPDSEYSHTPASLLTISILSLILQDFKISSCNIFSFF